MSLQASQELLVPAGNESAYNDHYEFYQNQDKMIERHSVSGN